MVDACYLLRVRLDTKQAVAAVGPLPSDEAYQAFVEASISADEEHEIVMVPSGVAADLVRHLEVAR